MKAILFNTADFFAYQIQVRTFNLIGWLAIYKVWILATIVLGSIVLLAGETYGWEKLAE